FYNAIANDGIEVKPRFIKEIRDRNRLLEKYSKTIINNSICSKETAKIAQTLMKNTVKRGTARGIYSESLPLAGKTGTALAGYGGGDKSHYTRSFAGFFPADDPKYSCVVVVNQPDKSIGFYGSQVAAPVFKEIADKIYTRTPQVDTLKSIHIENPE